MENTVELEYLPEFIFGFENDYDERRDD